MTTPREQAEAMVDAVTPDGMVVTVDDAVDLLADALARAEKAEAALAEQERFAKNIIEAGLAADKRIARLTAVVEAAKAAQAKADRLSGWITNVVRSKANKIHPDWLAERAAALVAFDEAVSEYHAALAALEEA